MDTQKYTLDQFGAKVRLKYPEYAQYSNIGIANKMLSKYPQYANTISDLPKEKTGLFTGVVNTATDKAKQTYGENSLMYKLTAPARLVSKAVAGLGDLFSGGTQKFGETTGQTMAAPSVIESLSKTEQLNQKTEQSYNDLIKKRKAQGIDTTALEASLNQLKGRQKLQTQISDVVPSINKSAKQVYGEGLGMAVETLSGGVFKGASKIAPTIAEQALQKAQFLQKPLASRLGSIGIDTAKELAVSLPIGYTIDVANNLQQDKSGAEIFTPGLGTLISSVIPLGIGGIRVSRQVAGDLLSKVIAPNLSGVKSGAYERLKTGAGEFIGKETPSSVLDDARTSATAFKSSMQQAFGEGKQEIINEFTGKRIGIEQSNADKLQKIATRFGFEDRLPQNPLNMSAKETMDLLAEVNNINPITEIDDPLVKSLKLNLKDIKADIMDRAIKTFGGEGGKFQTLYQDYATKKGILKNIQAILGKVGVKADSIKLNPVQQKTALQRLQRVFDENADGYFSAIKALEDETGNRILDKVAASQLSPALPKGLRGGAVSDNGIIGFASDIFRLLSLPLSSPRAGSWLISKIGGYDASLATQLLNSNPIVRKAIYNAVNKENMSFDDAVKLYARDIVENYKNIPNKSGGFIQSGYKETGNLTTKILKDLEGKTTVSKQYILDATNRGELKQVERDLIRDILERETGGISKDPLIQEAKKYKSAEVRDKTGIKLQDPYTAKPLPLNEDGTITLYHSTTKQGAEKIMKDGIIGSKVEGGEIYFTTNKKGYGGIGKDKNVVLEFHIDPKKLKFDDIYRGEIHLKGNNADIGGLKPKK